ncbi:MAG: ASCH domain-containing protein [Armatimonadetes bacterium]|nr:ASCH domain-containing protein [Armatimonadota bacterium]
MKALSIRQPFVWLLANGHKDIENRRWGTRYRGRFLIHAARTPDTEFTPRLRHLIGAIPVPDELDYGGIVGVATIIDCVTESDSPWFCGPYGFVIVDAAPLPFVPLRGMLGFFEGVDPLVKG